MSSVVEAIVPPQNPELQPPAPTPEELFAEHVALTREADALDVQRSLKAYGVGAFAVAASLAAGLAFTIEKPGFTPLIGAALGVVVAFRGRALQKRGEERKVNERLAANVQEATGQAYELYRLKDNSVAMHWRGPLKRTEDTASSLKEVALLAGRHDIKSLCIDTGTAFRLYFRNWPGKTVEVDKWLKEHKNFDAKFDYSSFQEATPAEWAEYAEKIIHTGDTQGVKALVEVLGKIDADDPLIQIHKELSETQGSTREEAAARERAIKLRLLANIEPRLRELLSSAERKRVPLQLPELVDLSGGSSSLSTHYRVDLSAHLYGDEVVQWLGNWPDSRGAIETKLGLNPERIGQLLKSPAMDPQLARKAILYLLYSECRGVPKQYIRAQAEMPKTARPTGGYGFQEMIAQENRGERLAVDIQKELSRAKWRIYGGAVAALAAGVVLGLFVDNRYDAVKYDANRELIVEQGLDPEHGEASQADIRQRMGEWDGWNTAWAGWTDARKAISIPLNLGFGRKGPNTEGFGDRLGVGNVGNEPDRVEYKLEASGMELDGYWWQGTSNVLVGNKDGLYWRPHIDPTDVGPIKSDISTAPDLTKPFIRVTHDVKTGEAMAVGTGNGKGDMLGIFVPFPVREGTKVSAATLDGKPVAIRQLNDNTYTLFFGPGEKGGTKLEYWLTPSSEENVRNIRTFTLEGDIARQKVWSPEQIEALMLQRWENEIPGFGSRSLDERRRIIDKHIKAMDYSFNPFDAPLDLNVPIQASFVDEVLDEDKANCNVAATARRLSVSDSNEVAVFGYTNTGGRGRQVLSSRERHMALLNDREVIDITPSRRVLEAEPSRNRPESPLQPWMLIPGVIGLAALGYRRRDILYAGARKGQAIARKTGHEIVQKDAEWAGWRLSRMNPAKRALAAELSARMSFAPDLDLETAKELSKTSKVQQEAGERLRQPHIHHASVVKRLAKQKDVPRFVKRALRRGRRAARLKQTDK